MWAAARTHLLRTKAPNELMPYAVDYAMYVDLRMATTPSRKWVTPYEQIKGVPPSIDHIRPFYTKAYVTVPKHKRKALKKKGITISRAEVGRFLGFQDSFSTTFKVLLDGNRLVHSRNVTFDIDDYVAPTVTTDTCFFHFTMCKVLAKPACPVRFAKFPVKILHF